MRLVQREKQRRGRTQFSQLKSLDSELLSQLKETLPPSLFELNGLLSPINNPILRSLQSGKTVTFDGPKAFCYFKPLVHWC